MTNVPIRGLGGTGVITDVGTYNLPVTAFTRAKNVRFNNGSTIAGPVFRPAIGPPLNQNSAKEPKHIFTRANWLNTGHDQVFAVNKAFNFFYPSSTNSSWTQASNAYTVDSELNITSCKLADCIYINRADQVPLVWLASASGLAIAALANWPSNYRASVLRPYGDFLFALNTTEAGTNFPNRVRWSDPVVANSIPTTWDAADVTNSAGFNDLVEMQSPIIDGANLGSNFIVFSSDQVWSVQFVGGTFIFQFSKIFDDAGVISTDCIVNVERRLYVFDADDIYMTDGNTRTSICDGRVRDYIFKGLNKGRADACFAFHNEKTEEIYFCYNSQDDMVGIKDPEGRSDYTKCNRAAVYNYSEDNWTFQDMPNVVSHTDANLNTTSTYATLSGTYANMGGSFLDQDSPFKQHPFVMSVSGYWLGTEHREPNGDALPDAAGRVNSDRVYGIDQVDGGSIGTPYDTNVSLPIFLERQGLDLDEMGTSLSDYKVINKLMPQISSTNSDANFTFTFGATDTPNTSANYEAAVTFNSTTDYKVDTRMSGRYLSYKLGSTLKDFVFSGMDVEVVVTGKR